MLLKPRASAMDVEKMTHNRRRRGVARKPTRTRVKACLFCLFVVIQAQVHAFPSPQSSFCYGGRVSVRGTHGGHAIVGKGIGRPRSAIISLSVQTGAAACLDPDDSGDNNLQLDSQETSSSSATSPFVGLPSYKRIVFFVATTFLIWVSEPLLSLVDSAAVGRYAGNTLPTASTKGSPNLSSVIQLASLGPATTVCDNSIYLTLFISMATTNKLARAFAKHDLREQVKTLSHSLGVSLALGGLLLLFINFQGANLLSAIIGPAGATVSVEAALGAIKTVDLTPDVLRASLGYARIRSIVSPLAVMGMTSQAALLCAQDTKTPALAVLVASILNIVGDYIFVAKLGYGVRGAALATSLASFTANGMLVGKVWKMTSGWKHELKKQEQSAADILNSEGGETSDIPFISFPDGKSLASLLLLAGPMFFVMVSTTSLCTLFSCLPLASSLNRSFCSWGKYLDTVP